MEKFKTSQPVTEVEAVKVAEAKPDQRFESKNREALMKFGIPTAFLAMGVGAAFGLTGCGSNTEAKKPTGITAKTPEKQKVEVLAWEKSYDQSDLDQVNESGYGVIDRKLLNDAQKQALNYPVTELTGAKRAEFLATMSSIYHHWLAEGMKADDNEAQGKKTTNTPNYVVIGKLDQSVTPDDIKANLDMMYNGYPNIAYKSPQVLDFDLYVKSNCAISNEGNTQGAQASISNAEPYRASFANGRIDFYEDTFSVTNYVFDLETKTATFDATTTYPPDSGLITTHTKYKMYEQAYTDPATGKPATMVMYETLQTSGS